VRQQEERLAAGVGRGAGEARSRASSRARARWDPRRPTSRSVTPSERRRPTCGTPPASPLGRRPRPTGRRVPAQGRASRHSCAGRSRSKLSTDRSRSAGPNATASLPHSTTPDGRPSCSGTLLIPRYRSTTVRGMTRSHHRFRPGQEQAESRRAARRQAGATGTARGKRPAIGACSIDPGPVLGESRSRRPGCRSHFGCPRWSCGSQPCTPPSDRGSPACADCLAVAVRAADWTPSPRSVRLPTSTQPPGAATMGSWVEAHPGSGPRPQPSRRAHDHRGDPRSGNPVRRREAAGGLGVLRASSGPCGSPFAADPRVEPDARDPPDDQRPGPSTTTCDSRCETTSSGSRPSWRASDLDRGRSLSFPAAVAASSRSLTCRARFATASWWTARPGFGRC
jgi:hypothetical protein